MAKGASDKSEPHVKSQKTSYKMFAKIKTAGIESQSKVEQIAGDSDRTIAGIRGRLLPDGKTLVVPRSIPKESLKLRFSLQEFSSLDEGHNCGACMTDEL